MGIFDYLKKKKQITKVEEKSEEELPKVVINEDRVNAILEQEIKEFFPTEGHWYSNCFRRSNEVGYNNLPCHLRDNAWMSKLLHRVLNDKGIYIPQHTIKHFMDNSETFANLRHEYELRIVEWQIKYMRNGGDGWLMPNGFDEFSLLFSEDVDKMFRGGIVKTLSAIGMNSEVIEEGIEKCSDMWRPVFMEMGFEHKYQPHYFLQGTPEPYNEEHKKNWLANREYEYYQEHAKSVDKYGTKTSAMCMTQGERIALMGVLNNQNKQRLRTIEQWKKSTHIKSLYKPQNLDDVNSEDYSK